ncbi:FtsQ-type POTRA domain-containing protein [Sneathiella chungangensis]|uniref:Cell division protein FtsQ n=1 Tax=Sneathiella chungangensis TaxID=1418234 RepID=A0A845MGM6_9PROT|nr:cell division protein FtsQ/DivIB [Sneathiella chungangensis]MZR22580.1 FtsQ-type POTRA domain-containing protein [Sneathiella chungangensis]
MRPITIDKDDRVVPAPRPRKSKRKSGPSRSFFGGGKKKKTASGKAEPRFSTGAAFSRLGGMTVEITDRISAPFRTEKPKRGGRRKPAPAWRKPTLICGAVLLAAVIIGGVTNFMVRTEVLDRSAAWIDEQQQALAEFFGLTVQEISVIGRDKTSGDDILKVLNVKRGDSILGVDPEAARERLETLGWVETASVMRRYPDEIFIEIRERRPYARWQIDGRTGVIDRTGAVVSKKDEASFRYLPKVVGPNANEHAAELFDMLAQTPELFTRVQNAVRIRDRRWDLEFDNGVKVLLPEKGALQAWKQLNKLQDEQKILDKDVVAIDMRAEDRMYVRLNADAAKSRRVAGNDT